MQCYGAYPYKNLCEIANTPLIWSFPPLLPCWSQNVPFLFCKKPHHARFQEIWHMAVLPRRYEPSYERHVIPIPFIPTFPHCFRLKPGWFHSSWHLRCTDCHVEHHSCTPVMSKSKAMWDGYSITTLTATESMGSLTHGHNVAILPVSAKRSFYMFSCVTLANIPSALRDSMVIANNYWHHIHLLGGDI